MDNLIFIINVVIPVFSLIVVGYILKKLAVIDEPFVKKTSSFVYQVSLPTLIFMKLFQVDLNKTFDYKMVLLIVGGTVATFLVAYFIEKLFKLKPDRKGVFIQGAFRSNYAIVGLAIISRMFSEESLSKASFLLLFALPLYNLLAIFILSAAFNKPGKNNALKIIKQVLFNPLVLAVFISMPFSLFKISLPSAIVTTGNYLAAIALPVALIGIGGSLELRKAVQSSGAAITAALIKIILSPLIVLVVAVLWNIHGEDLGILFVIFACPTAVASFVLAAGMNGNIKLAGNIIIISTLGSVFTIIAGLYSLKYFGFF